MGARAGMDASRRREESRTSALIRTLGIPASQLVTVLTELSQLHWQST